MPTLGEPDCVAGSHSPCSALETELQGSQSLLSGEGTGWGVLYRILAVPFISHTQ